jgi:hypothetical protein
VFAVAFVIAFVNVVVAFHAGVWLAGAVPGIDLAAWTDRLSLASPRFLPWPRPAPALAVEPFWVAAHVALVHRLARERPGGPARPLRAPARGGGRVIRLAVLLLLAAVPAPAQEGSSTLTLDEYRGALESVAARLESGDWEGARSLAGALRGGRVAAGETAFEVDPTLLAAVDAADDAAHASRARQQVLHVLASLDGAGFAGPEPDAARLARLAREEAARRPREGGSIDPSLEVRRSRFRSS